jgi:hypothetical protein
VLVVLSSVSKLNVPLFPPVVSCASTGTIGGIFTVNNIIHIILQYSVDMKAEHEWLGFLFI